MKRKPVIYFSALFVSIIICYCIMHNNLKGCGATMEGENISKPNLEKGKEYQVLLEKFSKSNYMVVKGKVMKKSKESILSPTEEKEMKIIGNALDAIKGKISVPEEAKVIIQSDKNQHVVIFENKLPKGWRGGDYSAKVTIDSMSGKILEILGSD